MTLLTLIERSFLAVADISWHASLLIGVLLLGRVVLKRLLPPRWVYLLWFVVLARLLLAEVPSLPAPAADQPMAAPLRAVQAVDDAGLAAVPLTRLAAASSSSVDWPAVLSLIWLAGTLALLAWFGWSHWRWTRRLSASAGRPSPELEKLVAGCCEEMGVRPMRTALLPGPVSPSIAGIFRPVLVLPEDCESRFGPAELRWIVLHEAAHLRRGDLPVQLACQILQAVHWFNPLVWIAWACLRHDRELACDADVLDHQASPGAREYGHTLIKVAETYPHSTLAPGFLGITEERTDLEERVRKISRHRPPVLLWTFAGILVCAVLAFVFLTQLERPQHVATAKLNIALVDTAIPKEIEIIQSSDVVLPAVSHLGLDKTWAARFGRGEAVLTPADIMDHVAGILTVTQRPGAAQIVYINVKSDPPQEAADLANALAAQYKTMADARDRAEAMSMVAQRNSSPVDDAKNNLASDRSTLETFIKEYGPGSNPPQPIDPNSFSQDLQRMQLRIHQDEATLNRQNAALQREIDEESRNFTSNVDILARAY